MTPELQRTLEDIVTQTILYYLSLGHGPARAKALAQRLIRLTITQWEQENHEHQSDIHEQTRPEGAYPVG